MKKILPILLLLLVVFKTEAQSSVFPVIGSLLQKGNYKKALSLLETAEDQNSLVLEKTADIYQTIGNYNKAISNYLMALEISTRSQLKTKLANVYSTLGYKQKAIDLYNDVFERDSSNLLVANNLGKLYLISLKPESAEKMYRYLKTQDLLNPNYPYQLGKALALQGRQKKTFNGAKLYRCLYD